VKQATAAVIRRASAVIANSRWLASRLAAEVPAAGSKTEIANCGIDLDAFHPVAVGTARSELGWEGDGPAFLCVGSLIERKNVIALADAFAALGRGRLAFVGDGPLRERLEGRDRVTLVGRIPQADVPRWVAAADVLCQPSLIEPFGQATLEGMAMERSVVATTVGGPPEFVTADAGVLVAPGDVAALTDALEQAAGLPSPNRDARVAASRHDVKLEAAKMAAVLERAAPR
jgi:glycosyltransferase involved in cell wall biosynthesis